MGFWQRIAEREKQSTPRITAEKRAEILRHWDFVCGARLNDLIALHDSDGSLKQQVDAFFREQILPRYEEIVTAQSREERITIRLRLSDAITEESQKLREKFPGGNTARIIMGSIVTAAIRSFDDIVPGVDTSIPKEAFLRKLPRDYFDRMLVDSTVKGRGA